MNIKYCNVKILKKKIDSLKKNNLKIGFTNGCFDLLHKGHIKLLVAAKKSCDFLVVAINSDDSVKLLKGKNRPIDKEKVRVEKLSKVNEVDLITIFSENTPEKIIFEIIPDVLIKGADYKKNEIIGVDIVLKNGGEIKIVELIQGVSTTKIINFQNQKIK
tara:strand:- start:857 stop:1336 length:480 start_codon:yes stop_codon:yes gene_type:complete